MKLITKYSNLYTNLHLFKQSNDPFGGMGANLRRACRNL